MGNAYALFETDSSREKGGIEIDYGDFKIYIARAGGANKAYQKSLEVKSRPFRRAIQAETLDPETMTAIMREVYADTVILRWEGVTDRDGNDLPFTKDNCIKLFTDLPDLFEDVMSMAQKSSLFKTEMQEAEAKN